MSGTVHIEIVHTEAGALHPSGWLVRVAGEIAVIAPIVDALRVAQRMARNVHRSTGAQVGITLTDEDGTVVVGRYGDPAEPRRLREVA